ncbi:enoyl-CoA hydratase [Achromobacter aloeverae]|uniref:Enoyl-CoA hydratase n=1 Tax=Achromobacter aloeverae TaxID=1750518 RepID=A0A4Q1HMZ4_9BURK|nr:enoyl-CoA hydratase [Achromobacter aloeverae]RXN91322.1 enoyl-CoA hydratase [Achromobacter aloeverae]
MTTSQHILSHKTGAIGWLVFNHPEKHNAVSLEMSAAVPPVIAAFDADPEIRVVIVKGAGDRSFIAGSNISNFDAVRANPEANRKYQEISQGSYDAVYNCTKPTIAMIKGYCMGGGMDYAASCDIRICSADSVFAIPAARLGLGYGYQGQVRLNRLIGASRARDLYFTGRRYDAAEALAAGLVHEVVEPDGLEARVRAYADAIAENAPLTIRALKRVFLELEKAPGERDMDAAHALIGACYDSEDYREGKAAFAEKRKPRFGGR